LEFFANILAGLSAGGATVLINSHQLAEVERAATASCS